MKKTSLFAFFFILLNIAFAQPPAATQQTAAAKQPPKEYEVKRLKKPMTIDANWDKKQWKKVKPVDIALFMGAEPKFRPVIQAKLMYDDKNIYVIFHVQDKFVRSLFEGYNGGVSNESCVEFFFSPDTQHPDRYFHLEANAGGNPFFAWDSTRRRDIKFKPEEMDQFKIASTLPKKIDPEITEPVTWTLECSIPLDMLRKYTAITEPKKGVTWTGNFFKTAGRVTSNTHYVTWNFVDTPRPDFHTPAFFGKLLFK